MASPFKMTFEELDREYENDYRSRHWKPNLGEEAYDFNIKIQKVWIPDKVREAYPEIEIEAKYNERAQLGLQDLVDDLKYKYDWIRDTWQEGRSGGWLVLVTPDPVFIDGIRLGAPRKRIKELREIDEIVTKAKKELVKDLENEGYWEISPRDWSPRWRKIRKMRK